METSTTIDACIDAFRSFNRFYTNQIGLLQPCLPGGAATLSEARILFEIASAPEITAAELGRTLAMDRGQLSRILKTLEKKQLIRKHGQPSGRKPVPLTLTDTGTQLLRQLEQAANTQARNILAPMDGSTRRRIIAAMREIGKNLGVAPGDVPKAAIRTSRPGDLGWVLMRHGQLYAEEYGFDADFECYVLQGMLPFSQQADMPGNMLWIAEQAATPLGSIAVMRNSEEEAQLRWFFVEQEARGAGLGKELLRTALDFCRENGFSQVFLLTIDILPAARHLYASFGFQVVASTPVRHWGHSFNDERWELRLSQEKP